MPPTLIAVDPLRPDAALLEPAAAALRGGRLVAFPTETVYGLGAIATDPNAVGRIFAAKRRPADNPLIVHVARPQDLQDVAARITPLARDLARRYWPGPLTLVLDAHPSLPPVTTGGLHTVAVRMPSHPVALLLLQLAGVPVAAPSANRSGRPSPTQASHVLADLQDDLDVLVDGGEATVGMESTVVDARGSEPLVLRDGAVTREDLGAEAAHARKEDLRASPGMRYRHYAPACRVEVVPAGSGAGRSSQLVSDGQRTGLVAFCPAPEGVHELAVVRDAADLGRRLYALLRAAEDASLDVVVVEAVEEAGIGRAVMDRLRRASSA